MGHEKSTRMLPQPSSPHVLQGAKYVLLEPGHRRQAGDEFWGGRSWIPTYPQHIGTPVDTTHLPYRRPISLPSSVRPEGKPQGPSTTPPASSGAAGADVQSALIDDEGFPYSAAPVVEENSHGEFVMACALNDKDKKIQSLTSERDQLRKENGINEARIDNLKDELKFRREEVEALASENAALRNSLSFGERQFQEEYHQRHLLAQKLHELRSQFRWTPISERLPTEKDADEYGQVWTDDPQLGIYLNVHYTQVAKLGKRRWMTPIPFSQPSPETEEQTSRKRFETWATDCGYEDFKVTPWGAYENENTDYAWSAWNAGRQSTKEQA